MITTNITTEMSKSAATIWFWSVVPTVAGLWVLLPFLFHAGYKTDVVEIQFLAKEWVIANHKHPMLPAWILEAINVLTGRVFVAPFIVAALCSIVTLFSVWRLARKVLSERLALIGTFVMLPFWKITVESINYNQNSVLIACWALTMLLFYNAFQTNKKRWWIATGLTLGLGLHVKYPIVLLAVAVLLYTLRNPRLRRYWKETGPWLTVSVAFVVFLPHLIWLAQTDFWSTTSYAAKYGYVPEMPGIIAYFYYPIHGVLCAFGLILISPLLLLLPSLGRKWKIRQPESETENEMLQYLLYCMAFPFLVISSVTLFGLKSSAAHTYPLWFVLGIYLLLRFQRQDGVDIFRRTLGWTSLAVFAMVIITIIYAVGAPYLRGTAGALHFPMRELGEKCDEIWYSRFDTPCLYTTGGWFYAGNAAYAMRDRPTVHFYYDNIGDPNALPTGTWSTDEDVNREGGIILWGAPGLGIPDWVHNRFPRAEVLPEPLVLTYRFGDKIPPRKVGIAIVAPLHNESRGRNEVEQPEQPGVLAE